MYCAIIWTYCIHTQSYHCSYISSLLVLPSLVLHPIEKVLVFFSHSLMVDGCRVTTIPFVEKPLVSVYILDYSYCIMYYCMGAESPQCLRVKGCWFVCTRLSRLYYLATHSSLYFQLQQGFPLATTKHHHHAYVHHESFIVCQHLFVDISYYFCGLESITPPVKFHFMTLC